MASQNNLEIKGNLREHPLAELLVEILQIRLNGSLRIEHETQKVVIYFDASDIVFAVSNSRQHRLYEILLRENKVTKEQLISISDFTSDFALSENLLKNKLVSKAEIDLLFSRQIEEILHSVFDWQKGEWVFSPLVRVKGDIRFKIDLPQILIEYARKLPNAVIIRRFKSLKELFQGKSAMSVLINLLPPEAFVFSRFEKSFLSVENISVLSGMSDAETLKILYTLWLGGLVSRQDWNTAFNERKTSAILSANLTLRKGEKIPITNLQEIKPVNMQPVETTIEAPENGAQKTGSIEKLSLEDYLHRIETVTSHYEFLDVAPDAPAAEIKTAYFALAKRFHPDLFHKKTGAELHSRVQNAFTKLAHAYEILKVESSREVYDYKLRKELDGKENTAKNSVSSEDAGLDKQIRQAMEDFNQGFNFLMDENIEAALPFLARAVHFDKDNARYHAFYGKALSFDKSQHHKAESEIQTAIKLDAENADFRIILAEFFIEVRLIKRAEGELNRLLAIFPDNEEAQTLLDSLAKR